MHKHASFALALLLFGSLGAGLSCLNDDVGSTSDNGPPPNDGGSILASDDGGEGQASCPSSPPKIGERCPMFFDTSGRCSYITGSCAFNGKTFEITHEYCCFEKLWFQCGTNDTPCEAETTPVPDAAVPPPDAAPPPADLRPEVGVTLPVDVGPDTAPDAAAPDAPVEVDAGTASDVEDDAAGTPSDVEDDAPVSAPDV